MTGERVFVVTGANKGIGYYIVENLAQTIENGVIYLTARNPDLGNEAVQKLTADLGSKRKSEIKYLQLDVTDQDSIKKAAQFLKQTHDGLDVLINNAGIVAVSNIDAYLEKGHDDSANKYENAQAVMKTNYYGPRNLSKALIPIMRKGGKIVNVSSTMGTMNSKNREPNFPGRFRQLLPDDKDFKVMEAIYPHLMGEKYSDERLDQMINGTARKDETGVDGFVEDFLKSVKAGNPVESGFPSNDYRVSKAALIGLSVLHNNIYARKGITVNAVCPGFCSTDLNDHRGTMTPQQGADTPAWLAVESNVPSGQLFSMRSVLDWN